MFRLIAFLIVVCGLVADASACIRCNRNPCIYAHSHIPVAPVVVPQQPLVLSVQNNYPQANGQYGAQPLTAPQGNTLYTLGQAIQPYQLDPAALLHQSYQMTMGAQSLSKQGTDGGQALIAHALSLQAEQNKTLTQATAAKMVLDAAGIHPASQQLRQQNQGIAVYQNQDGSIRVEQLKAEQIQATNTQALSFWDIFKGKSSSATGPTQSPNPSVPVAPAPANSSSLLAQKCAKCHGTTLAEPKGGLYLDGSQKLSCDIAMKSMRAIRNGSMPKGETLTVDEKARLEGELLELSK